MSALTEDVTKAQLAARGLPVPPGIVARSVQDARGSVTALAGDVVVKALVPIGGRGKAGAIRIAQDADARADATASLLGSDVRGHSVSAVYLEAKVDIAAEYFLCFTFRGDRPEVLASTQGGIDIEEVVRANPDACVTAPLDVVAGLAPWDAMEIWLRAGLSGPALPAVAAVTSRLYDAFRTCDALTLEINPLVVDRNGDVRIVGAMMAIDDAAAYRHPEWPSSTAGLSPNPRERAVEIANATRAGGEARYVELDGDIGLLVGGGGAGLYIHDLVLELGGRPANHCVTPPTSADDAKLKAVLRAIFGNPRVRGVLIGFNFAQMARTDIRVRALVEVIDELGVDTSRVPVVIRLFGAGEETSRALTSGLPNVHYVPRGTTLADAAALIVRLTAAAPQASAA